MDKAELKLRESIIHACRSMNGLGINQGTSGNISARYGKLMLITPSGVPYEELKAKDLVTTPISGKGDKWNGALAPSSEWRFHLRILQDRPEVGSVVHTHSTYATTLAICNKPIPAIHYMVAAAGGPDIRVAPYATYGTEELSDLAEKPEFSQVLAACRQRLYEICDPAEVDARAKRRQAELLEENGGRDAVIKRGDLGFSPPPGYPIILG